MVLTWRCCAQPPNARAWRPEPFRFAAVSDLRPSPPGDDDPGGQADVVRRPQRRGGGAEGTVPGASRPDDLQARGDEDEVEPPDLGGDRIGERWDLAARQAGIGRPRRDPRV